MTDFENDDLNELAEFYITKINLLEAKLDKAREALFSASKFVDHLNPSSSMTEYLSKALQEIDK